MILKVRARTLLRALPAMAALWIVGSLGIVGSLADGAFGAEPGTEVSGPRLVIPAPIQSFGVAIPSAEPEVSFLLRNEGSETLTLQVGRSRGLEILEAPEEIAPGEEARVRVRADVRRHRGPVEMPMRVVSNDPVHPEQGLAVVGQVEVHVEARPGFGRWTVVQGEADGTIRQTLAAADQVPFEVTGIDVSQTGLRAEYQRGDGGTWVVDLTLDRWAPVGALRGDVVVHTTHPLQGRVLIPVSGFVRPILAVTPHELAGEIEVTGALVNSLSVRVFSTEPVGLLSVEHDLPGVPPAEIAVEKEGREYSIGFLFGAEIPKGPLQGRLRITTDHPSVPSYVVPVDVVIR